MECSIMLRLVKYEHSNHKVKQNHHYSSKKYANKLNDKLKQQAEKIQAEQKQYENTNHYINSK